MLPFMLTVDRETFHFCFKLQAITACEKQEKWEAALQLMADLEAKALHADVVTYSAMVSACDKAGHWQMALCFLRISLQVGKHFRWYNE